MTIGTTYEVADGTLTITALPARGDKMKYYKLRHHCYNGNVYDVEMAFEYVRKIDNLMKKIE
jgi:phage terminase large subunit GpA-like protein